MQENEYHYLYVITNSVNSKIYVGIHSTENLNDKYLGSGKELSEDKKKYGNSKFTLSVIKYFGSRKEALAAEKSIVTNDFRKSELTYNIKRGGLGGWHRPKGYKHTKETLIKMSNSSSGRNNPFYGKTHTKEAKHKMSRFGIKHTDSTKESMSKSKSGKNNPMYGTIAPNAVYITIDEIKYTSIKEASIALGISPPTISRRCKDPRYPNYKRQ